MSRRVRISGYSYKNGRKTITVKSYLRHVTKSPRKKSTAKVRTETSIGYDRERESQGARATGRRSVERKKLAKTTANKNKVRVPSKGKSIRKGRGKVTRNVSETQVTVRHPRSSHRIDVDFKGVRSVERKKSAFSRSEKVKRAIASQLRRKDGRPPKGFIIHLSDKDGNMASKLSPPDMVVNADNISKLLDERLTELAESYDPDMGDEMGDEEGYGDYDPSSIVSISIQFFYGT